eukprot:6651908-Pyramimonas_sp.AAC.1
MPGRGCVRRMGRRRLSDLAPHAASTSPTLTMSLNHPIHPRSCTLGDDDAADDADTTDDDADYDDDDE